MAQKHPGYQPQRRQVPSEHVSAKELTVNSIQQEPCYEELFSLLEVSDGEPNENPDTLFGVLMSFHLKTATPLGEDPDEGDMKLAALVTAKSVSEGAELLQKQGIDLLANKHALSSLAMNKKVHAMLSLTSQAGNPDHPDPLGVRGAVNLFTLFSGNKRIAGATAEASVFDHEMVERVGLSSPSWLAEGADTSGDAEAMHLKAAAAAYDENRRRVFGRVALNPSQEANKHYPAFRQLVRPAMQEFVERELALYEADWLSWREIGKTALFEQPEDTSETAFAGQILDYTILPEGTDIQEFAKIVCEGLNETDRASIDLRRVQVLENLRKHFGDDNTHYVRGKPRNTLASETGEHVNEEYIGLIIKRYDEQGRISGEDAIVVSPVANKHAGYVVRHDFSKDEGWRNILVSPKQTARQKGARPLKFTSVMGMDTYDAYVKKAIALFGCTSEEFSPEYTLRLTGTGDYKMRLRPHKTLGELTMRVLEALE